MGTRSTSTGSGVFSFLCQPVCPNSCPRNRGPPASSWMPAAVLHVELSCVPACGPGGPLRSSYVRAFQTASHRISLRAFHEIRPPAAFSSSGHEGPDRHCCHVQKPAIALSFYNSAPACEPLWLRETTTYAGFGYTPRRRFSLGGHYCKCLARQSCAIFSDSAICAGVIRLATRSRFLTAFLSPCAAARLSHMWA